MKLVVLTVFALLCATFAAQAQDIIMMGSGNADIVTAAAAGPTLDPSHTGSSTVLSNHNLTATNSVTSNTWNLSRSTVSYSNGRFFLSTTVVAQAGLGNVGIGIVNGLASVNNYAGVDFNGITYRTNGSVYINGATVATGLPTASGGQIVDMAVDFDTKLIWFRVNGGMWNGAAGDPATDTGGISFASVVAGPYWAAASVLGASGGASAETVNFGALAYTYARPASYHNWGDVLPPPGSVLKMTITAMSSGVAQTLAFNGPSSGIVNTASSNFTATISPGSFNGTQTVTINDGTQGGFFVPSVGSPAANAVIVTPTAGTSSFTFTYEAVSTGSKTLTFSNSLALAEAPTTLSYTGVTAANLAFSGPSSGFVGTPSSNFTAALSPGTFDGTQTVTLSDGSQGGTFTPSVGGSGVNNVTVTPTNGTSSFTFTYNPGSAGTKLLVFSNSLSIGETNPTLSYVASAPVSLAFSGPSSGIAGLPSTNFTVALSSGTFNGTQSVTIDDGGQGGTITPSVGPPSTSSDAVTPTSGSSSFTFTYTPVAAAALTLSFTNSLSLAESPTSLAYTASANSYTASGPSSGTVGVNSTNFTVALAHGTFNGAQTITIADGAQGGTITPSVGSPGTSSVTVTPASAATGFTFTYNAAVPGSLTLAFSNAQSWTDPSSLPFAATGNSYTASGPSTGTVGVTSTNFTVALATGSFNGSQTITIADGSQGGTITPSVGSPGTSTVTVTPVASATGFTFTYNAASPGTKTIAFTNAQSWTDPASLSFAASAANSLVFSGPASGTVGLPSSNFTVALSSGTFNGSQTVTIADGSNGGTITPSVGSPGTSTKTVTPTNATSSFTFTYNAASSGSKTLTFTNSLSLTENPSSLSYAAAANSFTASGPSSGIALLPSTNFTVALATGTFNGSQTITIADGSNGGTITPSVGSPGTSTKTVTPVNGATGFTFTYTPASAGTKTLSFTNAQSWNNPASLSYAATNNSFTASGPSSGIAGVPSTNFTVALSSGTFNGSQTVTIADGSNGGTITPSVGSPGTSTKTVTPTAGTSNFTFTYTAASNGSKTLAFTNAQSWNNPASLSYAAAVNSYTASGPASGTVGVNSSNFTIALVNGAFNGTQTITISDGGQGGCITPNALGGQATSAATVTPTAGTSNFTFTYNAASIGTKTLAFTNAQGWNNPAALSYMSNGSVVDSAFVPAGFSKTFEDTFTSLSTIDIGLCTPGSPGGTCSIPYRAGVNWYNGLIQCCMAPQDSGATLNNHAFTPITGVPIGGTSLSTSPGTCPDGSDCTQYGAMYPTQATDCLTNPGSYITPPNPFSLDPAGGLDLTLQLVTDPTLGKGTCQWYSAVPRTLGNDNNGFSQQYGYFEMRAQLPASTGAASGTWPGFWMFPLNGSANAGEIDIMEQYGHAPTLFCSTVHDYIHGTGTNDSCQTPHPDLTAAYHDYGFVWTATTMYFMLDGVVSFSTPTTSWLPAVGGPYYLMFDNGIGGGWPTQGVVNPSTMKIGYIRAYQGTPPADGTGWDGTVWNGASAAPTCTGCSHGTFYGTNITTGYNIYLPPGYNSNCSTRYPVIYYLHGKGGSENTDIGYMQPTLQSMIAASSVAPMIEVFVNGGLDSQWTDAIPGAPAFPWYEVQSMFFNNFIPFIDANYCTKASPGQRAIQGSSMGGQGCLNLAFLHPTVFSSAYCFMPATDGNLNDIASGDPGLYLNEFNSSASAYYNSTPWSSAINNAAAIVSAALPTYITIGSVDPLYTSTTCSPEVNGSTLPGSGYTGACAGDMLQLMTNLGIAHDALTVVPGCGHDTGCLESGIAGANFTYAVSHFVAPPSSVWDPYTIGPGIVLDTALEADWNSGPKAPWSAVRTTNAHASGKIYYEMTATEIYDGDSCFGIVNGGYNLAQNLGPGTDTNSIGVYESGGNSYFNNAAVAGFPSPGWNGGDNIGIAVDFTNHLFWVRVNGGNWNNSGTANPATGAGGGSFAAMTGPFYAMACAKTGETNVWTLNAGQSGYAHTPPAGFGNW